MSLLLMEGFEGMGTTTGAGGASALQTKLRRVYRGRFESQGGSDSGYFLTNGETTGYALHIGSPAAFGNSQHVDFWLPSNQYAYTLVIGLRFRQRNSGSGNFPFITIMPEVDISENHLELQFVNYTYFRLLRNATQIAISATGLMTADDWYYVEFKFKIHQSTGLYDIKLDDTSVLSASGLDTQNNVNNEVNVIRVHGIVCDDPTNHPFIIDDMYILNDQGVRLNDFLGKNTNVRIFYPDADGSDIDFTPSIGTDHYALVDETDPSASDYNQGVNNTDRDLYGLESISSGIFHAIMPEAIVQPSADGIRNMRHVTISGATTSNGATVPVVDNEDLTVVRRIQEDDPNTGNQWTTTDLNNAEFGVEVQT